MREAHGHWRQHGRDAFDTVSPRLPRPGSEPCEGFASGPVHSSHLSLDQALASAARDLAAADVAPLVAVDVETRELPRYTLADMTATDLLYAGLLAGAVLLGRKPWVFLSREDAKHRADVEQRLAFSGAERAQQRLDEL
jgi:hypothetical protein